MKNMMKQDERDLALNLTQSLCDRALIKLHSHSYATGTLQSLLLGALPSLTKAERDMVYRSIERAMASIDRMAEEEQK